MARADYPEAVPPSADEGIDPMWKARDHDRPQRVLGLVLWLGLLLVLLAFTRHA